MITTLSPADSFFFFSESHTQHQHVMGIIVLDPSTAPGHFDVGTLIAQSEELVDEAPGFRLKFVDSPAAMNVPMMAEDPNFNFRNHIHHIALPSPGNTQQLSELVANIASRPLNHDIPLWENWYVSGLEGGLIAIVSKSHHSMSDGVSGAETMARMFDLEPDPPAREGRGRAVATRERAAEPTTLEILQAAVKARRKSPSVLSTVNKAVRGLMRRHEVNASCEHPEFLPGNTMRGPKVFFNGQISSLRSVAMGTLPLSELKRVKNAFSVTLNDAVLAVVAIAVRRYLEQHDDLPDETLSCMVPISLALNEVGKDVRDEAAANQTHTINVKFPVQIEDPVELIQTLHQCSSASKQLFNDTYDNLMMTVVDTLPPSLAAPAMSFMTGEFSARFPVSNLGVSNIPGPNFPLYMRGARVVGNYPLAPIPNGIGLGITMMSYLDEIYYTVQGCREKTPDIHLLSGYMQEAMVELAEAADHQQAPGEDKPRPRRKSKARKATGNGRTSRAKSAVRRKSPSASPRKVPVKKAAPKKAAPEKAPQKKALRKAGSAPRRRA